MDSAVEGFESGAMYDNPHTGIMHFTISDQLHETPDMILTCVFLPYEIRLWQSMRAEFENEMSVIMFPIGGCLKYVQVVMAVDCL